MLYSIKLARSLDRSGDSTRLEYALVIGADPPAWPASVGGGIKSRLSGALMRVLLDVISLALEWYTYVIVIVAIMSWLIAFNVINVYNDLVRSIWNALNALTEPALRPIRRVLPNMGGLDISPVILILIIILIRGIIATYIRPYVF
jgi:YggT family protein